MLYGLLVTTHLFCATAFIGIVFFEVLILEGIRQYLPPQYMSLVEEGIHRRGRKIMPWFVGTLFLTGITMALWVHSAAIADAFLHPFTQSFGTLLSVKIILALSVLVHFIIAMRKAICGNMTSKHFKYTHLSVFFHVILIVILAKGMFFIHW